MDSSDQFVFAICQVGVEWALKEDLARRQPDLRFAFSRPGFVTFKLADDARPPGNLTATSAFVRTWGCSLGKVAGTDGRALARQAWEIVGDRPVDHIHAWERDEAAPGERRFEPGVTPLAHELGEVLAAECPRREARHLPVNQIARPRQSVLDCVLVEPDQWWIGLHHVETVPQRWPGGVPNLQPPEDIISRAYLKTSEALLWSRLPTSPGDRFVEVGCAPGGSAQALLERGFVVMGIDPAEIDERLLQHEGFLHVRKRAADLKRREFRRFPWLTADLNVAPRYTLDAVEDIVTYPSVHVRGMLLTLKLLDQQMYKEIGDYVGRVRGWGYEHVRVRQLAFNRREICLAALRSRALRRSVRKGRKARGRPRR